MAHVGHELVLVLARDLKIFDGLGKLARPRLDFLEQPHVLDRNYGLVGKSADQVDLLLREGSDRAARQEEHANRRPFAQEWNSQRGAETSTLLRLEPSELRIGEDIRDVNRATLHHGSSSD